MWISDSKESKLHGGEIGQLWFIMHNTTDKSGTRSSRVALNSGGYHEPGSTYTAVVAADGVFPLKSVEIEWVYQSNVFNPLSWRLLASPRLFVDKVEIQSLEKKERQ